MKILWLTNIPSPYRVDFFNELGKACALTVLFERRASDERDQSWQNYCADHFESIFLKGKQVGVAEAFCPEVVRYLDPKQYDFIFVTNYSDPTGILAIAYMKMKGISYIIEGDGAFAGHGNGLRERLKRWIISGAELCFSTAAEHDRYYRAYGAAYERIVRYPFTSLHDSDILPAPIIKEEKQSIRSELGVKETYVILAVGQFIHRKGYDILIRALADTDEQIGCYIVGGKAADEYRRLAEQCGVKNRVHFVDFKKKPELKKYYEMADVFVHPTREDIWGLVVNEAMAAGLPVVTTDRCNAGLELIRDERIGRIVPVEDAKALADALNQIVHTEHREVLGQHILEVIRGYTVEQMAKSHIESLMEYKNGRKE